MSRPVVMPEWWESRDAEEAIRQSAIAWRDARVKIPLHVVVARETGEPISRLMHNAELCPNRPERVPENSRTHRWVLYEQRVDLGLGGLEE